MVKLSSGAELSADLVILSIGVRPDTRLAREAGLSLAPNGAILVDERMRTDDPAIYALGDACAFRYPLPGLPPTVPLAGPANKQARVVANSIVRGDSGKTWKGSIAVGIAKVFDLTAASAGASEKALAKAGIRCASLIVHGNSHAGYYPGAVPLSLKAVYDPESGRLYGAQAVGYDGVDKRIDVLAEAVRRGARVTELAEFEHAYAPPNDEVRLRLAEIPRDRPVLIFCGVGLRGYLAERILRQNGWTDVANLSGGYKTWELASERQDNPGTYRPGLAGIQGSTRGARDALLTETWAGCSG